MGSARVSEPGRRVDLVLIATLFVLSLPFPALPGKVRHTPSIRPNLARQQVEAPERESGVRGLYCLVGVPWVCCFPAWWANPALIVGCAGLAYGAEVWPRRAGWIALVLAVSFPFQWTMPDVRPLGAALRRSCGLYGEMGTGFWLWLASIACLVICAHVPRPWPFQPGKVSRVHEM